LDDPLDTLVAESVLDTCSCGYAGHVPALLSRPLGLLAKNAGERGSQTGLLLLPLGAVAVLRSVSAAVPVGAVALAVALAAIGLLLRLPAVRSGARPRFGLGSLEGRIVLEELLDVTVHLDALRADDLVAVDLQVHLDEPPRRWPELFVDLHEQGIDCSPLQDLDLEALQIFESLADLRQLFGQLRVVRAKFLHFRQRPRRLGKLLLDALQLLGIGDPDR